MKKIIVAGVILLLAHTEAAIAEKSLMPGEQLVGIKSLDVVVERMPQSPRLERELRTAVVLKLRSAGIVVDPHQADPFVYVQVSMLEVGEEVAFSAEVRLKQWVTTENWEGLADTWDRGVLGLTPVPSSYVLESVGGLIDEFLNDYLTANPR